MIKRAKELPFEVAAKRFGGNGEMAITRLLEVEEFQGKGRLFAHNKIRPNSSIGFHQHKGDFEAFYILKGEGVVDDNGTKAPVKAGDVVLTKNGESHGMENTGNVDLEYIALVLFA